MLTLETKMSDITAACQASGVRRLEVFGSGACGKLSVDSDIDFIVEFTDPLLPGLFDRYLALHAALENIFQRKVDLVEHSAIANPVLAKQIEEERKLVYAA